jgi:hypothetical protein
MQSSKSFTIIDSRPAGCHWAVISLPPCAVAPPLPNASAHVTRLCHRGTARLYEQLLKWKGAALATPVVMGLCGGIFFVGSIMGQAAGASQVRGGAGPASGVHTVCDEAGMKQLGMRRQSGGRGP